MIFCSFYLLLLIQVRFFAFHWFLLILKNFHDIIQSYSMPLGKRRYYIKKSLSLLTVRHQSSFMLWVWISLERNFPKHTVQIEIFWSCACCNKTKQTFLACRIFRINVLEHVRTPLNWTMRYDSRSDQIMFLHVPSTVLDLFEIFFVFFHSLRNIPMD